MHGHEEFIVAGCNGVTDEGDLPCGFFVEQIVDNLDSGRAGHGNLAGVCELGLCLAGKNHAGFTFAGRLEQTVFIYGNDSFIGRFPDHALILGLCRGAGSIELAGLAYEQAGQVMLRY